MKCLAAILFSFVAANVAWAQTNVGVSVSVAQPGVYGRVEFGNAPPPVVYAQPVIVVPAPAAQQRRPIYLYVPPGQQKHWAKHCARYNACGQPVYFVQERWVRERYDAEHRAERKARKERRHNDEHRRGGSHHH